MIIPKVMNSECNAASSTNHHGFVRRSNNNNYNLFPTSNYSNHGYDKFIVAKSNNNFIPSLNNNNGVGALPRGPAGPTYIVRNHQIPHNNHYNNTSSTTTTSADQKCTKINSLIAKFSWKDGAHSSGASLYPPPITKVTSTSPTTAAAAELPIICYGSRFNNNFFGNGGDTINDYPTLIKRNNTVRDPSGSCAGSGGSGAIAMSQHHYSKPVYSLSRTDSVSSSKTLISGRGCGNGGGVISPFPAPTCPLLLVNNGATNQKSPTVGVATSTPLQIIEVYDDTKFGLAGLKKKRDEESAAAISHPQQLPINQQQSTRHPSRDQIDGGCSFTYKYGLSALKDTTITPRNTAPDCPRPGIDSTEFISVTTTTTTTSTKKKQPSISGLIEQYQMKANQLLAGPKTVAPPTPNSPNPTPGGSTQTLSSDTEMINAVTPTPSTYPHPLMPPSPPPYHKSYETTDEPESPFFHNGSSSLDSEEMSSNHPSCCYYEEDEADSQLFTFRTGAEEEAGEEPYCKLVGFGKAEESSFLGSGSATVSNNMAAAVTLPPSSSYHGRQCSEDSTTSSFSSLLLIVSTPHHMILNAWQQQQQQNPPDGVMMTPPEPDTAGPRFVHHDVQQILEGCVSPVPLSFSSSSASSASSVASFTSSSSSSSSSNPNNNNNNTTNGGSLAEEIPPPATGLPLLNSRDLSSPSQDDPTTTYLRLKAASGDSFDFDPPVPNLSRGMPAPGTRSSNHQGNGETVTTSLPGLTTASAALKSSSNSIDSLIQQSPVKEIVGGINNNRVVNVRDHELLKSNGINYRLSSTPAPTPHHNHHPQPKQLSSTNKRGAGWNNTPTSLFSSSSASAHGPRQQRRNASSTNNLLAAAGANNSCSSSVSLGRYHAAALQNQHQVYITRSDSRGSIASLTSLVSLASSTSYLSPHELQHLIEDANQSLDQTGNGAGEYVIQVIILYREHMGGGIGITLAGGIDQEQKEIRIHKVITGSVADKDGRAQKGDRVLSINGKPMHNLTHRQSVEVLKAPRAEVVLVLSRLKDESDVSYLLNNTLGESSLQLPLTNNLRNNHRILLNDNGPFNENDSYESYQLMDQEECLTEIFESSSNPYPERNSVLRLSNSFDSPTNDFLTSDTFTEPHKLNNHKPQQQSLDDMKTPNRTTDNKEVPLKNNSTGSIDLNDIFTDETGLNSKIFELELENQSTCGLGISLEGGKGSLHGDKPITIKRIFKGGTVEKCGVIQVGDEMLKINGETTEGMTHFQAWNFVKSLDEGRVTLTIKTYQHHT